MNAFELRLHCNDFLHPMNDSTATFCAWDKKLIERENRRLLAEKKVPLYQRQRILCHCWQIMENTFGP